MNTAQRCKAYRHEHRISISQAAKAAYCSPMTWVRYEAGELSDEAFRARFALLVLRGIAQ